MTEVELLKLQVEALEKLVKIKDGTISELEKQAASKPATSTQYIYYWPYYPYNINVIPSQWQQYPYYQQPHYGGAGGLAGQGGYGTGGGAGVGSSGIVSTFTGAVGSGGNAVQTTGYMQTLDFPKPNHGSSN